MKHLALLFFFCISFLSHGQVTVTQPEYYYVSKWKLEELQELPVGTKILFQQNCTTKLPANVPTGTVFFENVYQQDQHFSIAVEFKDTVIVSATYYLKAKQTDLLKAIGYPDVRARGSAVKGQWTAVLHANKRHTTIVGDKKRIVVIETL
ncbi:MAG: hypothetical protein K0S23_923 [Fluviicola sp.]|jgi:hypothetical protein|uniref:hypothetical protein n=1 Tax=Fluviicola sp. TaxID=1917219 RepID=UPI00262DC5D5|nr:hypothetical protein [Fluviicola sp.]MDF3026616.1 hypothetical protein [Fluviicola sp.]